MNKPPTTSSRRRWVVLAVGQAAVTAGSAFQFGLAYLIPALREGGLSLAQAGLLVSCPMGGLMFTLIIWGVVADRWGERLTIGLGLGSAGLALLAASTVSGPVPLGGLLAVAGAAGAAVHAASGRLILGWFGAHERGLAMGIRQTAQPLGVAVAAAFLPGLGHSGSGPALLFLAALSLATATLVVLLVRDPGRQAVRGTAARLVADDPGRRGREPATAGYPEPAPGGPGAVPLRAGAASDDPLAAAPLPEETVAANPGASPGGDLVTESPMLEGPVLEGPVLEGPVLEGPVLEGPVLEGPQKTPGRKPVLESPVTGVPTAEEPRAWSGTPYRTPMLWRIHLTSGLMVVPQFATTTFSLLYLVDVAGWEPARAGRILAAGALGGAVMRLAVGVWSDRAGSRFGPFRMLIVAIAVVMAALAAGAYTRSPAAVVALLIAVVITVSPNGLAFTAVAEYAGNTWAGRALGIQNTVQNVFAVATPPLLGAVVTGAGYGPAFAAVTAFPLVAILTAPAGGEQLPG